MVVMFLKSNRACEQGDGLANSKLNAMVGMFCDSGNNTVLLSNVAAGSERAGFSGPGTQCSAGQPAPAAPAPSQWNEATSCLAGFWFDYYSVIRNSYECVMVQGILGWKLWLYGIYGEVQAGRIVKVDSVALADTRVGVYIFMGGAASVNHEVVDKRVQITNSLLLAASPNENCAGKKPGLYTCKFSMAWCSHLSSQVIQIHFLFHQINSARTVDANQVQFNFFLLFNQINT
jgi:hypothetical protein